MRGRGSSGRPGGHAKERRKPHCCRYVSSAIVRVSWRIETRVMIPRRGQFEYARRCQRLAQENGGPYSDVTNAMPRAATRWPRRGYPLRHSCWKVRIWLRGCVGRVPTRRETVDRHRQHRPCVAEFAPARPRANPRRMSTARDRYVWAVSISPLRSAVIPERNHVSG